LVLKARHERQERVTVPIVPGARTLLYDKWLANDDGEKLSNAR
jgi:hypothetical protein